MNIKQTLRWPCLSEKYNLGFAIFTPSLTSLTDNPIWNRTPRSQERKNNKSEKPPGKSARKRMPYCLVDWNKLLIIIRGFGHSPDFHLPRERKIWALSDFLYICSFLFVLPICWYDELSECFIRNMTEFCLWFHSNENDIGRKSFRRRWNLVSIEFFEIMDEIMNILGANRHCWKLN